MKNIWPTYAWTNNEDGQVDFIRREIESKGVNVKIDREQIVAGRRLWPQIDAAISDPNISDAWAIYATAESLRSQACLEELVYALDRALRTRGSEFPLIGIFPQSMDRSAVPSALATRLFVSLQDPDWAMRVANAANGQAGLDVIKDVTPYILNRYRDKFGPIIEVRPRAGRWYPAKVLVPEGEREKLRLVAVGPSNAVPGASMTVSANVSGGGLSGLRIDHAVDNLNSLYIYLTDEPSQLIFGQSGGELFVVLK